MEQKYNVSLHENLFGVVDDGVHLVDVSLAVLVSHHHPVLLHLAVRHLPQLPPHHQHHHHQVHHYQTLEIVRVLSYIVRQQTI